MRRRATVSVGYLKSVFLPIIRRMNPLVQFPFPFIKTKNISRWPGSAGHGIAKPAQVGWNPIASFRAEGKVTSKEQAKVDSMYQQAMQLAFTAEAAELRAHVARKMQQISRKHSVR
jgi:hypothetical protein